MSTRALSTTSFKSSYVSLDLLSYLKSGQVTPFQIFNDVIMPDFYNHISKGIDNKHNNSSSGNNNNNNNNNLQGVLEEIQNDLIYIGKACRSLKQWEDHVNHAIKELVYQSLDDADKERRQTLESTHRTNFLVNKLNKTHSIISDLKKSLSAPPELSSVNLNSDGFQLSSFSMSHAEFKTLPFQLEDDINEMIAEHSTLKKVEAVYKGLHVTQKLCLLCFSVFPEKAVIKKKVLVHWWVGEGFIDTLGNGDKTAEDVANGFFKEFMAKGLIEPFYKKRRPNADSCNMQPSIRQAVIKLAQRAEFFSFDKNGNPTEDFSCSRRACLVKTEQGSSVRELPFRLKQENVHSLINVNEPNLDIRPEWFAKMKYVNVLQLGRWKSSAEHLVQVEDSEFLKGLKNMRHLRYLSLRGVSRITELPASICKLSNLRILNLNGCLDLEKLPQGIGSLKNLTHLDMYECYLISHMPKGLALLSQLQVLKGFVICKPRPGGQYCKLADLLKLENLRKLSIHVDKMSDAAKSELISLPQFKKLRSLSISWSRIYGNPNPRKAIARKLSMHVSKKLRLLTIQGIIREKLASMTKPTKPSPVSGPVSGPDSPLVFVLLEKLDLHYFPAGSEMPVWLKTWQLNNLKKLYIREGNLSDLCDIQCGWTNVKTLRLKFLGELKMDWPKLKELFPHLIYAEIFRCPKLSLVPCDENGVWEKADSKQAKSLSINQY